MLLLPSLALLLNYISEIAIASLLAQPQKGPLVALQTMDLHATIRDLEPSIPNYCNNSKLIEQSGLIRAPMGQFLGFPCSNEFYHCRWQSDGYRTYRKNCRAGLVYDVMGTQNCNYDYNVKGCSMNPSGTVANCTSKDFECPLSEDCVPLSKRCDGNYDCVLEEDEQNCPMCKATHFPCVVSEQCIPLGQRCNGIKECHDGTDELDCENCGSGKFLCRKSGKCISAKERCDGFAQCPHGEDEQLCKKSRILLGPRMFLCESGKHQIPQQNVCDGIVHCPDDASDEKYCQRAVAAVTNAPTFEFEMQSPPPSQTHSTKPATESHEPQQKEKVVFDQPSGGQSSNGPSTTEMPSPSPMPKPQQVPSIPMASLLKQKQQKADADKLPMPYRQPQINPQSPNQPGSVSFPRVNFNPTVTGNQPPPNPAPLFMMSMQAPSMKELKGTNVPRNGLAQPPPPTVMIQMAVPKKGMAPSVGQNSASMLDQMPYHFQRQMPQQRPMKTFVPGDFQAGVWNGTAYANAAEKNPYAEEWFSQFGQQQLEQNNLVQEETETDGGNPSWPSIPNYGIQQRPRHQLNEQRRAVNEQQQKSDAATITELTTLEPLDTGGESKTGTQQESTQMGMPMPAGAGTHLALPNENPLQNPWQKGGGNESDSNQRRDETEKSTIEQENREDIAEFGSQSKGKTNQHDEEVGQTVWTVTTEQSNGRIKTTAGDSIETGEEAMPKEEIRADVARSQVEENKNSENVPEKVNKLEAESFAIGKEEQEETEQKAILKRLYEKFGASAKDLLKRLENLLLLAETGIMAKSSKTENDEAIVQQEQQKEVMRKRDAQHREMVRHYMEAVLGRKIQDSEDPAKHGKATIR